MAVTRFLTRARIAERMGDFIRHLRAHGVRAVMPETMIDNYAKPSAILISQGLNQGLLPLVPDGTTSLKRS